MSGFVAARRGHGGASGAPQSEKARAHRAPHRALASSLVDGLPAGHFVGALFRGWMAAYEAAPVHTEYHEQKKKKKNLEGGGYVF